MQQGIGFEFDFNKKINYLLCMDDLKHFYGVDQPAAASLTQLFMESQTTIRNSPVERAIQAEIPKQHRKWTIDFEDKHMEESESQ